MSLSLSLSLSLRGLGLIRATWESFIQHINSCKLLDRARIPQVDITRNLKDEVVQCFEKIGLEAHNVDDFNLIDSKSIRNDLRTRAFEQWCRLPVKGAGVVLFKESPWTNQWLFNRKNLSLSQWTNAIKMSTNCVPVRSLPGRSMDGSSCRTQFCAKTETLSHILQACSKGESLRIIRHHQICDKIKDCLTSHGFEVYREVHCIDANGSNRRADIIAIDRNKNFGIILDPTIRFERDESQAMNVDIEKRDIYTPCLNFLGRHYQINNWVVQGLLFGARGSIPTFTVDVFKKIGIFNKEFIADLSLSIIKSSLNIVHNHLYG